MLTIITTTATMEITALAFLTRPTRMRQVGFGIDGDGNNNYNHSNRSNCRCIDARRWTDSTSKTAINTN